MWVFSNILLAEYFRSTGSLDLTINKNIKQLVLWVEYFQSTGLRELTLTFFVFSFCSQVSGGKLVFAWNKFEGFRKERVRCINIMVFVIYDFLRLIRKYIGNKENIKNMCNTSCFRGLKISKQTVTFLQTHHWNVCKTHHKTRVC